MQQFQLVGILLSQTKDFLFNVGFVGFQLIQVLQTFLKLYGLFVGYSSINSSLNFFNRVFAAPVNEGHDIKSFTRALRMWQIMECAGGDLPSTSENTLSSFKLETVRPFNARFFSLTAILVSF